MPENKKPEEPREENKKNRRETRERKGASSDDRDRSVLAGARSLSTPPGEPYNDVLLRRHR